MTSHSTWLREELTQIILIGATKLILPIIITVMSSQIIPRWWLLLLITYVINAEAVIRDSDREVSTLLRGAISQELSNLHTLNDNT